MPTVVALGIDCCEPISDARRLAGGDSSEPYLSLAVFDDVPTSDIEAGSASLAVELAPTIVDVSGVGTFQGDSPVVYASVILTEELRTLHASVHEAFKGLKSRPYYIPGSWVPHITLGFCENHIEAEAIFSRLLPHLLRGKYSGSALLLVSVPPVSIDRRYEISSRT